MIDPKQAAKIALQYFAQIYECPLPSARLEEIELTDDDKFWLITLSVREDPEGPPGSLASFLGRTADRQYKVFRINAHSGKVRAMKMRQPVAP